MTVIRKNTDSASARPGFVQNDGGRAQAGFRGRTGDCVVRSIAIAARLPYSQVYKDLSEGSRAQRKTKRSKTMASARNGVNTKRKWFLDYMQALGFRWVPTMAIGSGCTVHLDAEELPSGRIIARVTKHYAAMIDGVIHDTYDPRRQTTFIKRDQGQDLRPGQWRTNNGICSVSRRCVYGYWILATSDQAAGEVKLTK